MIKSASVLVHVVSTVYATTVDVCAAEASRGMIAMSQCHVQERPPFPLASACSVATMVHAWRASASVIRNGKPRRMAGATQPAPVYILTIVLAMVRAASRRVPAIQAGSAASVLSWGTALTTVLRAGSVSMASAFVIPATVGKTVASVSRALLPM